MDCQWRGQSDPEEALTVRRPANKRRTTFARRSLPPWSTGCISPCAGAAKGDYDRRQWSASGKAHAEAMTIRISRGTTREPIETFKFGGAVFLRVAGLDYQSAMPSNAVSQSLADEVHHGPDTVVDFARAAPFAWDRVFIFPPYIPKEQIYARLGCHRAGADGVQPRIMMDGITSYFRHAAVVCRLHHGRLEGYLMNLATPEGYSRDRARFHVSLNQDQRLLLSK